MMDLYFEEVEGMDGMSVAKFKYFNFLFVVTITKTHDENKQCYFLWEILVDNDQVVVTNHKGFAMSGSSAIFEAGIVSQYLAQKIDMDEEIVCNPLDMYDNGKGFAKE